ncbi:hypothetical protein GIB67_009287, partial [Kingdonia uniflora]
LSQDCYSKPPDVCCPYTPLSSIKVYIFYPNNLFATNMRGIRCLADKWFHPEVSWVHKIA